MADFLIQAMISNVIVSAILAGIAWALQRSERSILLANLLWTIVLINMVTPPLFRLPVIEVEALAPDFQLSTSTTDHEQAEAKHLKLSLDAPGLYTQDQPLNAAILANRASESNSGVVRWSAFVQWTLTAWLAVSGMLLVIAFVRVYQFELLLRRNSRLAPDELQKTGKAISQSMGLRRAPLVIVSSAHLAPFVWWLGGRPRILLSSRTVDDLNANEFRMVLAHEMAHLRRRDHWIRWIEALANAILWWCPLLWWTRHQLRKTEEIACDQLVIEKLGPEPHVYANTLLNMAELLATVAIRPPAVASGINSGGILEQRLTKIMSRTRIVNPIWLRRVIVVAAVCLAPLGLVYAQDIEAVQRRLGGAIEAGEITVDQAKLMIDALKAGKTEEVHLDRANRSVEDALLRFDSVFERIKVAKIEAEKTAATSEERQAKKLRYMAIEREIDEAVQHGNLSKEEAEKKLSELRREMFDQKDASVRSRPKAEIGDLEAWTHRFQAIFKKIEEDVKAGKLSKEDAEMKLSTIGKEMFLIRTHFDHAEQDSYERSLEAKKRKYMAVAQEIEEAINAGKLSKEDAEKKLIAIRKEMFEETERRERK